MAFVPSNVICTALHRSNKLGCADLYACLLLWGSGDHSEVTHGLLLHQH